MGPRDAPAGKALSESVEIVELAPSRLHEEVADEHPNQELHYPLLFVQQMDGPFNPPSCKQRPAAFRDMLCINACCTASFASCSLPRSRRAVASMRPPYCR